VLDTPAHAEAFRYAWSGISRDLHAYKGWPAYERLIAAALAELSAGAAGTRAPPNPR
jgi:dimethylamine monooxygenase subunit A